MSRMSYSHAGEVFYKALSGMVSGRGDIKTRLINALVCELHLLREDELPAKLWERFQTIYSEVTSVPDEGQGSIHASISRMTEEKASKIASELMDIFFNLAYRLYD